MQLQKKPVGDYDYKKRYREFHARHAINGMWPAEYIEHGRKWHLYADGWRCDTGSYRGKAIAPPDDPAQLAELQKFFFRNRFEAIQWFLGKINKAIAEMEADGGYDVPLQRRDGMTLEQLRERRQHCQLDLENCERILQEIRLTGVAVPVEELIPDELRYEPMELPA